MTTKAIVLQGDCMDTLPSLPAVSVDCCVTSPPYFGLRDYGIPPTNWPAMEYAPMAGVPSVSVPAMSCCLGLEPDPLAYVGHLVLVFREVRRVLRDAGTCWLNLGDSMGPRKQLLGIPWKAAFALQADGWVLRSDIIWSKPNPMPESVTDRPTRAHEYIFLLAKSEKYYYDADAIKEPSSGVSGGGFSEKTAKSQPKHGAMRLERPADTGFRNRRDVWTVTLKAFKGAHFATFPPDLIIPCVRAGCPKGGTVLDPFGGSGTTASVAIQEGRGAVICELNPDYVTMSEKRIRDTPLSLLFPDTDQGKAGEIG